ncbi:MAG: Fe-S cluster assembly protein SufD [Hyphomicrobiaceae bacterium]
MNVQIRKTKAEQTLGEHFEAVARLLPGDRWVKDLRAEAMGMFAATGLPHRRIEAWKYTDLRERLKEALTPAVADRTAVAAAELDAALGPLAHLPGPRIVFVNGAYSADLSRSAGLDEAVFHSLSVLLRGGKGVRPDWLEANLRPQQPAGSAGAPLVLNTAFMTDGAIVCIGRNAKPVHPLHLVFAGAGSQGRSVAVRNELRIGAGARLTIVESYVNVGGAAHQTNAVTHLQVAEAAEVAHIKVVPPGPNALHLSTWIMDIGAGAAYRGFQFTAGTALARNDIHALFRAPGARFDLSGAFLARGAEHIDTTLVVDHAVPGCSSRELFKGVLDERARGVFQGKIVVRPDAQKTDGKQMAQVLMLSEEAEFDSKPELEINADDVVCGHGSTSADLDSDLVFYCRSRGIPEAQARALLIEAFVGEALDKVEPGAAQDALRDIAHAWLAGATRRT